MTQVEVKTLFWVLMPLLSASIALHLWSWQELRKFKEAALPNFDSAPVLENTDLERLTTTSANDLTMRYLWASPVMTVNLVETMDLNEDLVANTLKLYSTFEQEYYQHFLEREKANKNNDYFTSSKILSVNEAFFRWQKEQFLGSYPVTPAYQKFTKSHAVESLATVIQHYIDVYLLNVTRSPDVVEKRSRDIFIWATLHRNCGSHLGHSHPDAMVSGTYYALIPSGAGELLFEDPRGPLPPFSYRFIHRPKPGDLVMFPGWLQHEVAATQGDAERISLAFNVGGSWDTTSQFSIVNHQPAHQPQFIDLDI
eukprot:TRINITY_DN2479_c0_g1_i2.p1 TRINITY_DN2479_c0_g1~~TRINITY_DN2479_c0_g1_i2.p1  ORF type:complete len:311 (-),score=39.29 TRINITY_DN2479_c0_g1_i2:43-975(-)